MPSDQVVRHVEHGGRRQIRLRDARQQAPALEVSLRPTGALTHEAAHGGQALLVDGRLAAEAVLPTVHREAHAEVEILGRQADHGSSPRSMKRGQPSELPVAAEADAAELARSA